MRRSRFFKRLVLLAVMLVFLASTALGDGARDALEAGLTLKTTVTCEWAGAKLLEKGLNDALESVLEQSQWEFASSWPGQGVGRLLSFDWLLQGSSVLDWTGMRLADSWFERSNLFEGKTVCLASTAEIAQTLRTLREAFDAWQQSALTQTEETLANMRLNMMVVTREEMLALGQAVCQALTQSDAIWSPQALGSAGVMGEESARLLQVAREAVQGGPDWLDEHLPQESNAIICIDYDTEGNVLLRQADVTLGSDLLHVEWTLAEDGGLGELTVDGSLQGTVVMLRFARTAGAKESVSATFRLEREGRAILVEVTDSVSGSGKEYTRRTQAALSLEGPEDASGKLLTLTAKTSAEEEAIARPDEASEILFPAEMDTAELETFFAHVREGFFQLVYTVIGRLPADAALQLQTMLGIE